jgi:PST family polysaccharide transporter
MISSAISVLLAIVVTIRFGLFGALINAMLAQVCIFGVNMVFVWRAKIYTRDIFRLNVNKQLLWKLFKFATMSLTVALIGPTSTLLIRNYIINGFSVNEAGFVQGVWNISAAYLTVVTTTLSIYYLPTLSSIKDEGELRKEIFKGYKFLLPLTIIGGLCIFVCRDLIISILYTPEFLPMKEYFTFQLIGDTFKIAAWILSLIIVAKAMTRQFIVCEVIFTASYVGLAFLFMRLFGSIGVTYGYCLHYVLYLGYMIWLFRGILFGKKNTKRQGMI